MSWFQEYKASLKNVDAEEPLDIYFFRPLAFIIVKMLYALPLTPNHYSLMALITGLISAYYFYLGTEVAYQLAAFYFLMFAIFDCCDGMVARLKKNGSEFGRIIDGLVDYTVNAAVYVALALSIGSLFTTNEVMPGWLLVVLAGVSKAIHSFSYDHYLTEYLSHSEGKSAFAATEVVKVTERLNVALKNKEPFNKVLMLKIYLAFTKVQAQSEVRETHYDPAHYCQRNLRLLKMWSLIGPAPHIAVLILAFLFKAPNLLFSYSIIFGNAWLLFMFFYQKQVNSTLNVSTRSAV
jgi:phosphatidylglycerophosphate synthase